jgi:hypothetical protein
MIIFRSVLMFVIGFYAMLSNVVMFFKFTQTGSYAWDVYIGWTCGFISGLGMIAFSFYLLVAK